MEPRITELTFWPDGMAADDVNRHSFAVKVVWAGPLDGESDRYKVIGGGSELSRAGNWAFHVPPFRRHQYRFTYDEACAWAVQVVNTLTINGRTWTEWEEHHVARRDADHAQH